MIHCRKKSAMRLRMVQSPAVIGRWCHVMQMRRAAIGWRGHVMGSKMAAGLGGKELGLLHRVQAGEELGWMLLGLGAQRCDAVGPRCWAREYRTHAKSCPQLSDANALSIRQGTQKFNKNGMVAWSKELKIQAIPKCRLYWYVYVWGGVAIL